MHNMGLSSRESYHSSVNLEKLFCDNSLAPDMHDLEPTLTRSGYNVKALSELLGIRQPEVRAFLRGQLPPGRTAELHHQLLAAGLPLGERLGAVENRSATG